MNDKMWKIPLVIRDGENEYTDYIYFFGAKHDAEKYGESYASTFFGIESGETTWDDIDRCWYEKGGTRAVRVSPPMEFESVTAMTAKGAFRFSITFNRR